MLQKISGEYIKFRKFWMENMPILNRKAKQRCKRVGKIFGK
jgi:hypothetical protein